VSGNQNWRTPPEFLDAVRRRFGFIDFDLAATKGHQVTGPHAWEYFSPEEDSLSKGWARLPMHPEHEAKVCRVAFLNPPFANLRPWAQKLSVECHALSRWTLMLAPASMGSGWWRDHVLGRAMVYGIPRMAFLDGEMQAQAVYPKDLALVAYGYGAHGTGYWDWRRELVEKVA
jgi:phage N-6-adenine-methyltransferase